ncbi:MAG: RluA family pseudouridine synthase [Limnobacter sp.]|nr:RluA family pseudouridine synthase [Limnobacter sp.]
MNTHKKPNPEQAILVEVDENSEDQRVDNFLVKICKGVPKSHIFRIIRSGEIRVNKKRVDASTKLQLGDVVRIPPIKTNAPASLEEANPARKSLNTLNAIKQAADIPVVFEDDDILVVNKPSGMAVHGGSGESFGVIECIREARSALNQTLELVHRIDRETSGLLIISKKRSALRKLQEQLRNRVWKKFYYTLVLGDWPKALKQVDLPLLKIQTSEKEQRVFVDPKGDKACSIFTIKQRLAGINSSYTLLQVQILTGRTHQIRVHSSANSHPIAGDDRYGDFEQNKILAKSGLKRMFLHAARVQIIHPKTDEPMWLEAPLAGDLQFFLNSLEVKS